MLRDWAARILQYGIRVLHKTGRAMALPDILSRHYVHYAKAEEDYEAQKFADLISKALRDYKFSAPRDSAQPPAEPVEVEDEDTPTTSFPPETIRCLAVTLRRKRKRRSGLYTRASKRRRGNAESRAASSTLSKDRVSDQLLTSTPNRELGEPDDQPDNGRHVQSDSHSTQVDQQDDPIPIPVSRLAIEQRADPYIKEIIDYIQHGLLPTGRASAQYVAAHAHQFALDRAGILRVAEAKHPSLSDEPPALLPRSMWDEVLAHYHDNPLSGHRKFNKLLPAIAAKYYFPGISTYLRAYTQSCLKCLASTPTKRLTAPLRPYYASYPGITVHVDCTKGNAVTKNGNSHIVALVDGFTGYVRLYPVPQPTGRIIAQVLLRYITVNSLPLRIVTDNGAEFANELISDLARLLGIKHSFITPYHSQGNGKVENIHRTVQTMIRAYITDHADNWDDLLPFLEFAMNTSQSEVTKHTPFYLHFGRHPT